MSEDREYYDAELISELSALRERLLHMGIKSEMTIDNDEVPGLLLLMPQFGPLYLTLADETDRGINVYRLSMDTLEEDGKSVDDIESLDFYVAFEGDIASDDLTRVVRLLSSGKLREVYPLKETRQEEAAALTPLVNRLAVSYQSTGAEEAVVFNEPLPCVILVDGNVSFISTYEDIGNGYLLHFRADIPYDDSEDEEEILKFLRRFNASHRFARCSMGCADMGITDEPAEKVITLHACTFDSVEETTEDFYGYFGSLFERNVEEFTKMWLET